MMSVESIEKAFYKDISQNINDPDVLYPYSEWLEKREDPRARLVSLELALNFGEYKSYKCPIDVSSDESKDNAWQELSVLHEENKKRVLDIPKKLSKSISLEWSFGYICNISVDNQQALNTLNKFINPLHLRSVTSLFMFNITSLNLPNWVNELPGLSYFVVSCKDVKHITKPFLNLEKVTDLSLSGNQLTEIPEWVYELHQLDELDLSLNKLSSIPDNLGNLNNLARLDLLSNKLAKVPKSIEKLTQLTSLNLSHNRITKLPQWLSKLSQLEDLRLHHNRIYELPIWIDSFKKLRILNLDSNKISKIPDSIGNLSELTHVDLSYNNLSELPSSIEHLHKLINFTCYGRVLKNIPDNLIPFKDNMHSHTLRLLLGAIRLGLIALIIFFIVHFIF